MIDLTRDQFIQRLVEAGWDPKDAEEEVDRQLNGPEGDCDGDMSLA
jgi:hypothetical protein